MAQHQQHLLCLHEIVRRNASTQIMFAFVRGYMSCSPNATVQDALKEFEREFQIDDFSRKSATFTYYKMLREYMNQNKIFNDKNKGQAPGRKARNILAKGLGTPTP